MQNDSIIRIHNKNFKGNRSILFCLKKFKGISLNLSRYILYKLEIPPYIKLNTLSQSQRNSLENLVNNNLINFGEFNIEFPEYMITDHITNSIGIETNHKIITQRNIIWKTSIKSYTGIRHINSQKVRGQRTKSTGRSNKKIKGFRPKKQITNEIKK
jgi:small subunit ribosomal protein S13